MRITARIQKPVPQPFSFGIIEKPFVPKPLKTIKPTVKVPTGVVGRGRGISYPTYKPYKPAIAPPPIPYKPYKPTPKVTYKPGVPKRPIPYKPSKIIPKKPKIPPPYRPERRRPYRPAPIIRKIPYRPTRPVYAPPIVPRISYPPAEAPKKEKLRFRDIYPGLKIKPPKTKVKRPYFYQPGIAAISLRIRAERVPKGVVTGIVTRPLVKGYRIKKKGRIKKL